MLSAVCICLLSKAQTGPGGVGDNTNNILWLRADQISGYADGENVTTWVDTSGNDDDAVQSDTSKSPDYTASVTQLNNMPALYFDGNDNCMDLGAFTHAASDYDIFTVYKADVTTSAQTFESKTGKLALGHERGNTRAYSDGSWRGRRIEGTSGLIVNFKLESPSSGEVIINGAKQDSNQTYTQRAIGGGQRIGSTWNESGQHFQGYMAEMIFYNTHI